MITFYRHSALGAKLGVDPATEALHAFWWLRVARNQTKGPEWASQVEARRKARFHLRMARWLQRKGTR